mgnify:CR=1 FL=1
MPVAGSAPPEKFESIVTVELFAPGSHILSTLPNGGYAVRTIPEVSGGMVVEDPHRGRVVPRAHQRGDGVDLAPDALRSHAVAPFVTGPQHHVRFDHGGRRRIERRRDSGLLDRLAYRRDPRGGMIDSGADPFRENMIVGIDTPARKDEGTGREGHRRRPLHHQQLGSPR